MFAAAVGFAGACLVALSAGDAGAAGAPDRTPRANGVGAPIAWGVCDPPGPDLQCARIRVPLDWDRPNGRTISLALIRHLASKPEERIGTMFANPGGPGDTGVGLVQGDPDGLDALGDGRFDVLSWDPRGTHASTRVKCFTSQRSESRFWAGVSIPTTKAESEGYKRTAAAYARRCGEVSGWLLPHISTADTVRDLEHLRVLMGEEKLTYLGLSYGTYLGQTYANMFRDRIRAMMLNGIVDPVEYSKGSEARLAATVRPSDAVFDQFLALCDSAGPERCALAGGRHTAAERFDRLSSAAKARADSRLRGAAAPLGTPEAGLRGSADLPVPSDQGSQDVADQCRESRRRAQRRRIDARERGRRLQHARRLGPHNAVDGDPVRRRERPPEIAGLAVGDREIRSGSAASRARYRAGGASVGDTLSRVHQPSTKEARFTCCTLDSTSVERSSTSACSPMRASTSTSSPSHPTSTR